MAELKGTPGRLVRSTQQCQVREGTQEEGNRERVMLQVDCITKEALPTAQDDIQVEVVADGTGI